MNEKIDVRAFFTNSKQVWISENFQNIILATYESVRGTHSGLSIKSADLQEMRTDTNAQTLVFTDSNIFLSDLAVLIQKQINGEDGRLLNDSSANYFFLRGKDGKHYSVLVRWEPAQKLWRCGAYLQEDLKLPNVRIFYPSK